MADVTFTTVTTRVQTLLGTDASLSTSEIQTVAQNRYEEILETRWWSKRLRDFTFNLTIPVESSTSTTATVTNGSASVTFIGTPIAAAYDGRQIRLGSEQQYFFIARTDSGTITLKDGNGTSVTWPGADDSDASWTIFQTLYQLPSDADDISALAGYFPVNELDGGRDAIEMIDPRRISTSDQPFYWFWAGTDPMTGYRRVELWPVPSTARILRGQYLKQAATLTGSDVVQVPAPLLVWATAADCCHILHAKQGSTETMWENKALFFERKANEVESDYGVVDFARLSPNRTLRKRRYWSGLEGTDFEVTHQMDMFR